MQQPASQVDVGPADPGDLAAPHPGESEQVPHRVEPVVGDGVEERAGLRRWKLGTALPTVTYGSFSGAGTVSVGGGGAQPPYMIGISQDVYQTEFDWTNFWQYCTDLHNGLPPYYNYFSQPTSWVSSGTYYHPAKPPLPPHCYFYKKGYEPYIDKTSAKTFSAGFNVLGFAGSAQTGYTTELSFKYYYGENGDMCGDQLWPNPGFDFPYAIP
jgi:hypothetical protein